MSDPQVPSRNPWLLGTAILLPLALIILLSVLSHRATRDLEGLRSAVAQRAALQAQTATLLRAMVDNETGQRGYVLSQNPVFLEPYDQSLVALPRLRQRLARELVDPEARRLFANLDQSVDR